MLLLVAAGGLTAYGIALRSATQAYDRALLDTALALAGQIHVKDGHLQINLPSAEAAKQLGLKRNPKWDKIIKNLSPLAQKDGLYLAAETAPDSYTNPRFTTDHPMVLGAFGMLPASPLVDTIIMKQTFDYVWKSWKWQETWGWDFPMVAMSATRLGLPERAVDALFMNVPTNTWLPNGHNYQNKKLRLYLPGNGGLLAAIAMMCAGYDGSPTDKPGFPKDGSWKVRWEGFKKLP